MEAPHRHDLEKVPLRVFVVWHRRFTAGEAAFEAIYDWLGGPNRELYRRGLGVPVNAWGSEADELAPPEIPSQTQGLTVVVPFLDGEFLGRKRWRDWITACALSVRSSGNAVVVLPWAVHKAAAMTPGIALLHLVGSGAIDTRELCRRVTEACVVRMRDPGQPTPLRIFISYARRDGSAIAQEVRQALQAYGHLSVFMDEHDLQPGQHWRQRLTSELTHGAAMFAIVTDAYASRAWCREELRAFREPIRDDAGGVWHLRPIYILDCLSGNATRSMFEIGNASAVRWRADHADDVVDNLVREVLFAEVHRNMARAIGHATGLRSSTGFLIRGPSCRFFGHSGKRRSGSRTPETDCRRSRPIGCWTSSGACPSWPSRN